MSNERCDRCGDPVGAGSPRYFDRVKLDDGRTVCRECSLVLSGRETPVIETRDVPVTMPSSNPPNTH